MAGTLDFNPHEAPPQELKDIFKSWKGPSVPEREHILNMGVENMLLMDSIPHDRLNEVFTRFSHHGKEAKPEDPTERKQVALDNSVSVYSSQNISGRKRICIIIRQGRTS
jgi:hypothetical protein